MDAGLTTRITSLRNDHVKSAIKLRRGRHRRKLGQTLIDGVRELQRAIEAGVEVREVFVCRQLIQSAEALELCRQLENLSADLLEVNRPVFEKIAYGQRTDGLLAVAESREATLAQWQLPDRPLLAVVERLEKPGNLGAILRSADGAGLSALIVADTQTDLFNPNVIRSSLGSVFSLPVCRAPSAEARHWLRDRQVTIYAARVDADRDYTEVDWTLPAAVVLGAEATGLTDTWAGEDVTAIRLPMRGQVDSLNVSCAAAVLFYEALRQRSTNPSPLAAQR